MDEALVLKVIAEQLRVPEESLTPETTFADLNANLTTTKRKTSKQSVMFWIISERL